MASLDVVGHAGLNPVPTRWMPELRGTSILHFSIKPYFNVRHWRSVCRTLAEAKVMIRSAATFLWIASAFSGDSWFVWTVLTSMLVVLLIGGILLLAFGIRDLLRDFRRFFDRRSHNHHVS
jgi:hypothetical protein